MVNRRSALVGGIRTGLLLAIFCTILYLGGCAATEGPVNSKLLAPGLGVLYFDGMFRHVNQVPDGDRALLEMGRPGPTILQLDNQFGDGEVFDSGKNRGVAVQLKGYLHFTENGTYRFQTLSNDGVELTIDGRTVIIDPDVHSDRLSEVATYFVAEPGYRPVTVKYFQRKGTAALRLLWAPPSAETLSVVPATAYFHLPEKES